MRRILQFILVLPILLISSCSDGGDIEFFSLCGVNVNGELRNPADAIDAARVTIQEVSGANLIVLSDNVVNNERFFAQLITIDEQDNEALNAQAIAFIQSLNDQAYFFRSDNRCTINSGGIERIPGTLVTVDGVNVNEELLQRGLASAETSQNRCNGRVNENCYVALEVEGAGAKSPDVRRVVPWVSAATDRTVGPATATAAAAG